jgi:hypothetical protein
VLDGDDMAVIRRGTRVPLRSGTPRFLEEELAAGV